MARQMGVAWTTRRPRMHAVRSLRWDVKWESAGNLEHASSSVCSFLEVGKVVTGIPLPVHVGWAISPGDIAR